MVRPLLIERAPAVTLLDGRLTPGRLEHERFALIGNDETVVVGEVRVLVTAAATLAMALEKLDDRRDALRCCRRPLEREPKQIHARQADPLPRCSCEHGLVADDDAVLVGADLSAEHPERTAQEHRVGLGHLVDVDPRAPHASTIGVGAARLPVEQLRLVRVAVGVLREEHPPRFDHHHRVAHAIHRTSAAGQIARLRDRLAPIGAHLAGDERAVGSDQRVRTSTGETLASLGVLAADTLSGEDDFPERRATNAVAMELWVRLHETVRDWSTWAQEEVQSWPPEQRGRRQVAAGSPDRGAELFEEMVRRIGNGVST